MKCGGDADLVGWVRVKFARDAYTAAREATIHVEAVQNEVTGTTGKSSSFISEKKNN